MDVLKSAGLGGVLSWTIAVLIGSQGSSGGRLMVHQMAIGDYDVFWSWPVFLGATGVFWALSALQR